MKNCVSWLIPIYHLKSKIPVYCRLVLFMLWILTSNQIISQQKSNSAFYSEKANQFKNRVEYDSALAYYEKSGSLLSQIGDVRGKIFNDLSVCDVNILIRNFNPAESGLLKAEEDISSKFTGDGELESTLLQVKGSYYLAIGNSITAKEFLYQSITKRTIRFGNSDTNLHYAYNKLGNLYLSQSDYDSAFICHKKALDLALKKKNEINYLTASSYQNVGISAHLKGDFQMAEICYTKSLELKEQLFPIDDPALAKIYWNLGKFYTDLSKYNIALDYYDKAERLLTTRYARDNVQFAHVYWNKGNVYTHNGDYVKATSYLIQAHSILETIYGAENQEVLKVLLDLGFAYEKKGDRELAIEYYNKAAINKNNAGIIKIYRNLGNIYMALDEKDSAAKYYSASIESAKMILTGNSYDLALCYQYYGEFLAKSENNKDALWYYSEAAEIFLQLFGNKNKDLSKVYRLQSEFFLEIKEYDSALVKIQTSLVALLPEFSSNDIYTNPSKDDFILDLYLLETLLQKANALHLKFGDDNTFKDLEASLELVDLAIIVTEEIRKTFNEEESQMILNNLAVTVFDLGVVVAMELFSQTKDASYLSKSFQYSEKGQAIILLSALRGLEAQSSANIPAQLKVRENYLTKELATYNGFLYQERQKENPDYSKIQLWSNEVFNLRLSHDSILSLYKKEFPEYFRLKFDYSIVPADSVRACLHEDQAMIEYCMTDSLVFGFLLTNNSISVEKLGFKTDLKNSLDSIRKYFNEKDFINAGQKEFEELTSVSKELYRYLIKPFEMQIDNKRLIIVPDGELGYLSFDLLLPDNTSEDIRTFRELPYLIKSNPISYSSSATIYFEQIQQRRRKSRGDVLAFAPSYEYSSAERNAGSIDSAILKLNPMVGTKEEIDMISGFFRTTKLEDEKATETYFKKHAGNYGILHLAMHTIIDDQNPIYSKLVFTPPAIGSEDDGYLNVYELFNLNLPGQLAVLSACNTGGGRLEQGEGIISLARGFFYAGIPSVVMTLWEIEDHSSADLMALFYKNLHDGYPNDVALQIAKVSYLENAGRLQSHPYFWAGYVNIGKTEPVIFNDGILTKTIVYLGIATIVLIMLIILFINRRVFFHKNRY